VVLAAEPWTSDLYRRSDRHSVVLAAEPWTSDLYRRSDRHSSTSPG
jgi:hypothetical protein